MSVKRTSKLGLKRFFAFWAKYHPLDNFHYQWARDHLKVHIVKRGDILGTVDHPTETSYFVAEGLLARVEVDPMSGKRKMMSLALPDMALTTTLHLHSHSLQPGQLVALRPGIIIALPHVVLRRFQAYEKSVDTLIDIFGNKEKRQLALLRECMHGRAPFDRYLNFIQLLPEIAAISTQTEQAELLDISRNTIQRVRHFIATRKKRRK